MWSLDFINDSWTRHLNGFQIHYDCHETGDDNGVASFPTGYSEVAFFDEPQTSIGFDYTVEGGGFCPDCIDGLVQFGVEGPSSGASFLLGGSGFLGILDTTGTGFTEMRANSLYSPTFGRLTTGTLTMDNLLLTRVPEPSTLLLFGSALALVQGVRYRRRSSK